MKPFYLIKQSCFLISAIFLFGCSSTAKGTSSSNPVSSVDSSEISSQNNSVSSIDSSENTPQSLQSQKEDLPVETYGFVYNNETQTNDLILLDCATGNTEYILSIEQNVGTACALSRNRTWLAYAVAKNEDLTSAVYLIVRNLQTGEAKNFFLEADFFQWIESMAFLPDNQTLIVNVTQGQQWENTVLYRLNVQDDTCLLLDSADFSGSTIETQEDLDALVTKYNSNSSLPLKENTGFHYVQFSLPAVAPDGKTIYYAATLYRSATPAYQTNTESPPLLWLGSGIWEAAADGTQPPRLIFSEEDVRTYIGRICLSEDGTTLAYSKIYADDGLRSDICLLDLSDQISRPILTHTEEKLLYYPRFWNGNNEIYIFGTEWNGQQEISYNALYHIDSRQLEKKEYNWNHTAITLETMFQ